MGRFNEKRRVHPQISGESLTQQSMAADADINTIIARNARGGSRVTSKVQALFGDFSSLDFLEAQNRIIDAKRAFGLLPSKIRNRFHNSEYQLIRFLEDPENREEAIMLGLIEKPVEKVPEVPLSQQIAEGVREGLKPDPEAQPGFKKPEKKDS